MDFFNLLAASSTAGCYDWPVIKQIVIAIGWVMKQIYTAFDAIGITSLGLCIIVLVLIVKFALLPLTIKQQKFSKLQQLLQPELRQIQKKYAGRRDNESMAMQQEEMKQLYAKYGTSQTGGCLQTIIQMPIIISLYGVIRFLPNHIPQYADYFNNIISVIDRASQATLDKIAEFNSTLADLTVDTTDRISQLSILPTSNWNDLISCFSGADQTTIQQNYDVIHQLNSFCGLDLSQTPWNQITGAFSGQSALGLIAILLPAIAGFAQWLSVQLMQNKVTKAQDAQNRRSSDPMDQMNGSMRTMNFIMPLVSVFFCFTVQSGVGLYWAISSAFTCVSQILINRSYRKMDMEAFKEANLKKAQEKAKKRMERGGEKGSVIARNAAINTKNIEDAPKPSFKSIADRANMNVVTEEEQRQLEDKAQKEAETPAKKKRGQEENIAAKAGLVQQYIEETGDTATSRKKYKKK